MRKKNEITEYVAAALIFVCAVAVSLGIFLVCTQNSKGLAPAHIRKFLSKLLV